MLYYSAYVQDDFRSFIFYKKYSSYFILRYVSHIKFQISDKNTTTNYIHAEIKNS